MLPLSVFQEGQYGVSNVFIGQPAIVEYQRYCTSSEHPIERCRTTKMKASADELQAIIDEA